MIETTLNTFADLDNSIEGIKKSTLCRGVSNIAHELTPSLFRTKNNSDFDEKEEKLMSIFKAAAKGMLSKNPESEIEWLALAQHHGLPTRLLDWSLNPLAALFFTVHSLSDTDGAVYIYDRQDFEKEGKIDLNTLNEIQAFYPSHTSPRVTAQSGIFTIHPTKIPILTDANIKKLIVPRKQKKHFMDKLVKFGIHHGTMFPDLDGLSKYLKYQNNY